MQGFEQNSIANEFQGNDQWLMDRLGKLTASRVVDILPGDKGNYLKSREDMFSELIAERISGQPMPNIDTPAMKWGRLQEPLARKRYKLWLDAVSGKMNSIDVCGVVDHPTIRGFACSPDVLVNEDGLGEIKCLHTKNHLDTILNGEIKKDYIWQMVAQLSCTQRKRNDYISYDPRLGEYVDIWVVKHEDWYKNGMIETVEAEAKKFLEELEVRIKAILERPIFGPMYKQYLEKWGPEGSVWKTNH